MSGRWVAEGSIHSRRRHRAIPPAQQARPWDHARPWVGDMLRTHEPQERR